MAGLEGSAVKAAKAGAGAEPAVSDGIFSLCHTDVLVTRMGLNAPCITTHSPQHAQWQSPRSTAFNCIVLSGQACLHLILLLQTAPSRLTRPRLYSHQPPPFHLHTSIRNRTACNIDDGCLQTHFEN